MDCFSLSKFSTNSKPTLSRNQFDYYQLMKARRMATRRRAQAACLPCKSKKARCSDFRPCARCARTGQEDCVESETIEPSDARVCTLDSPPYAGKNTIPNLVSQDSARTGFSLYLLCPPFEEAVAKVSQSEPAAYLNYQPISFSLPNEGQATSIASGVTGREWSWEAAAGPGKEDPFRDDWRRCQLLWGQGETAPSLSLLDMPPTCASDGWVTDAGAMRAWLNE